MQQIKDCPRVGLRPLVPGWKVVFPAKAAKEKADSDEAEPEQTLPALVLNETAHNLGSEAREKQTTPPKPRSRSPTSSTTCTV